jgi:spore germination protein GerM
MAKKTKSRHNQEAILFILMGLIIVGLIISGYFLFVRKILPELSGMAEKANEMPANDIQKTELESNKSLAQFIPEDEAELIRLYFIKPGKDALSYEARKIRKTSMLQLAEKIVESLISGPELPGMVSVLPKETRLRSVFFEKGTFIVDLSKEFKQNMVGGAVEETLAVYSIVNSITELDPKSKVQILINGNEVKTAGEHIDLSQPLTRLEEIISMQ